MYFEAHDEYFGLEDGSSDGHVAEAEVWVNSRNGGYVEMDKFRTGDFIGGELGTPDGSGNIPEGYEVGLTLRPEGCEWSNTLWLIA